jgi:hypothetical protein
VFGINVGKYLYNAISFYLLLLLTLRFYLEKMRYFVGILFI